MQLREQYGLKYGAATRRRKKAEESDFNPCLKRSICFLQSAFNIPNEAGASFRSDNNTALQALATLSSGASAPATTYAYQLWIDTTNNLLKQRDSSNTSWITIGAPASAYFGFASALPRSYLAGLTLSTVGSSSTMSIAAGVARDSTNASDLTLASSINKTTSSFSAGSGNGGLDTGSIANNTWYNFWLIKKDADGSGEVLISLSATAPTMPGGYTYKRRIGSGKTDGSAHWTAFIQDGDLFQWLTQVQDVSTNNPGNSAVTATLASIPTGVNVLANLQVSVVNSSASSVCFGYFSDLATNDLLPSSALSDTPNSESATGGVNYVFVPKTVRTNTSAQIRYRVSLAGSTVTVQINTLGWTDTRGRNA